MKKFKVRHLLFVVGIVLLLAVLTYRKEKFYTVHAEVEFYRTLEDGSLLTKNMENEKGKRYILIRDEESMIPEYISKEEYDRLVSENPLIIINETQNQAGDDNSE